MSTSKNYLRQNFIDKQFKHESIRNYRKCKYNMYKNNK